MTVGPRPAIAKRRKKNEDALVAELNELLIGDSTTAVVDSPAQIDLTALPTSVGSSAPVRKPATRPKKMIWASATLAFIISRAMLATRLPRLLTLSRWTLTLILSTLHPRRRLNIKKKKKRRAGHPGRKKIIFFFFSRKLNLVRENSKKIFSNEQFEKKKKKKKKKRKKKKKKKKKIKNIKRKKKRIKRKKHKEKIKRNTQRINLSLKFKKSKEK